MIGSLANKSASDDIGVFPNLGHKKDAVSVFIFNPFFNHFYCPTHPTVPTLSLCFPMSPYASLYDLYNLDIFPYDADTHTPFPLSLSSRPFTRYQGQGLLVVNFGLLRAISTILTILSGTWYFSNFFFIVFHHFLCCSTPFHSFLSVSLLKKRQYACY